MTDFIGVLVKEVEMEIVPKMVISEVSLGTAGIDVSSDDSFSLVLDSNVNVSNEFTTVAMTNLETHNIVRVGTSSSSRLSSINHEMVQAIWVIHSALVKNTVERTTQWGVRISCPHPFLTKRIPKNYIMLCCNQFPCFGFCIYIDFRHGIKRGKKYAEVFATDFGFARAYPMKNKSDTREAFSLIFQHTDVPDKIIIDGSK